MQFRHFILLIFTGIMLAGVLMVQSLDLSIYKRDEISTYIYWKNNPSLQAIQQTIADGVDLNAYSEYGWTPIMFAIQTGNTDIVTALVNAGANVNAVAEDSSTPLMQAVITAENPHMIKALLNLGADIHITDRDGKTALYYARQNDALKNTDIIRLLTP